MADFRLLFSMSQIPHLLLCLKKVKQRKLDKDGQLLYEILTRHGTLGVTPNYTVAESSIQLHAS